MEGGREGDSRPMHIHTAKCGEITITHVTQRSEEYSFLIIILHQLNYG